MEIDTQRTVQEREEMVRRQIISRGIKDSRVIQAMLKIPRHAFVPETHKKFAYQDSPLLIGKGQTISQPYIVAYMSELLEIHSSDRILEIGTGSGYQTAICAELAHDVFTVERIKELTLNAQKVLNQLEYRNIHFFIGDGSHGLPQHAPYDKIIVTACASEIYPSWIEELSDGGIIVLPIGGDTRQILIRGRKHQDSLKIEKHGSVVFVPLIENSSPNNSNG